MRVVTGDGKYVDPRGVPVEIKDPDEYADAFAEGAHWVPDVIDYCRSIGRLAESEEELLGVQTDDQPSATLEEEFSELNEGPLADLDGDEDKLETLPDDGLEGEQEQDDF